MPRAKGRASQSLIDRIHAKTARAIDRSFKIHEKEKSAPPPALIAQAIKFLTITSSTDPKRDARRPDRLAGLLKDFDSEDGPLPADRAITDFSTDQSDEAAVDAYPQLPDRAG